MGMLTRDQKPLIDHVVDSQNKYHSMKQNYQQTINEKEVENIKIDDENNALRAKQDYLTKLLLGAEERHDKFCHAEEAKIVDIRQKF